MGRIFIAAGHGEQGQQEPGGVVAGTTAAQEMIELRDLLVPELRGRGLEVLSVPDDLTTAQRIDWMNARSRPGDGAIEIQANVADNPTVRGAGVFYIAHNEERRSHGELLLMALLRRVPQLPSRGSQPDTAAEVGRLAFCRNIILPSLVLNVGFLTSMEDRNLLQLRRRDFALGIAEGLAAWVTQIAIPPDPRPGVFYPQIGIRINDQPYPEGGILVNHNPYIPVDLVDHLGINTTQMLPVRRIGYQGVVYLKAVDLRDAPLSIQWEPDRQTVLLRTILRVPSEQMDRIMGHGYTSDLQLMVFLKTQNPDVFTQFADIAKLYREEAALEGVNPDIAFCQMCLDTNFLRFGSHVTPSQNNFANLGTGSTLAEFATPRLGIRAQIQHLKAYGSTEPILQEVIDPRFSFVRRGTCPVVGQLGGRWAADLQYGDKILAILRRLYESAQLL
jgi:hypothetical protein